jgi:lipid II:glycine glycyltransferase (peptidoglycan interpeptide bridge formation enzyme)
MKKWTVCVEEDGKQVFLVTLFIGKTEQMAYINVSYGSVPVIFFNTEEQATTMAECVETLTNKTCYAISIGEEN